MIIVTNLFTIGNALAHGGTHPDANLGWHSWTWPPLVTLNLALLSLVYAIGCAKIMRTRRTSRMISRTQVASFYLSIFFIILALASPIDALRDVLGWVHMIQHNLLMMVAAPLFVYGSPGYVFLWAIPKSIWKMNRRYRAGWAKLLRVSRFSRPVLTSAFYAFTLWTLHIPSLYENALKNKWIHDFQHLAFFASSFLFWRIALDPYIRGRLTPAAGVIYLFITSLHAMILGVLMALSPRVWYPIYGNTAPKYGFNALKDQQIAGYIMWMPAGIAFIMVAILLLVQLLVRRTDITSSG